MVMVVYVSGASLLRFGDVAVLDWMSHHDLIPFDGEDEDEDDEVASRWKGR